MHTTLWRHPSGRPPQHVGDTAIAAGWPPLAACGRGDSAKEATPAQAGMLGIEPSLPVTLPSRLFHQDKTTGAFDQMLQHGL